MRIATTPVRLLLLVLTGFNLQLIKTHFDADFKNSLQNGWCFFPVKVLFPSIEREMSTIFPWSMKYLLFLLLSLFLNISQFFHIIFYHIVCKENITELSIHGHRKYQEVKHKTATGFEPTRNSQPFKSLLEFSIKVLCNSFRCDFWCLGLMSATILFTAFYGTPFGDLLLSLLNIRFTCFIL